MAKYGNKGIEIAQKAYYNAYKEEISVDGVVMFLRKNASKYSSQYTQDKPNQKFNTKRYKEVIPEVLAKHNSDSNEFTEEFYKLMKGVSSSAQG